MLKLDTGVEYIHKTLQHTLGPRGYFGEQERNEPKPSTEEREIKT
jgi:hypothetical protein